MKPFTIHGLGIIPKFSRPPAKPFMCSLSSRPETSAVCVHVFIKIMEYLEKQYQSCCMLAKYLPSTRKAASPVTLQAHCRCGTTILRHSTVSKHASTGSGACLCVHFSSVVKMKCTCKLCLHFDLKRVKVQVCLMRGCCS